MCDVNYCVDRSQRRAPTTTMREVMRAMCFSLLADVFLNFLLISMTLYLASNFAHKQLLWFEFGKKESRKSICST